MSRRPKPSMKTQLDKTRARIDYEIALAFTGAPEEAVRLFSGRSPQREVVVTLRMERYADSLRHRPPSKRPLTLGVLSGQFPFEAS